MAMRGGRVLYAAPKIFYVKKKCDGCDKHYTYFGLVADFLLNSVLTISFI